MKKILTMIIMMVIITAAHAQIKKTKSPAYNKGKQQNTFLKKQWWIGVRGGVNFTDPVVEKSYAIITPTNYEASLTEKKYDHYTPMSSQIGLEVSFYVRGFSITVQPVFENIRFVYTNQYSWTNSENSAYRLDLNYRQQHQLQMVSTPVFLRYEHSFGKIAPYISAGAYGSFLLNATKEVEITGTDYASGGAKDFESEPVIVGATDLFQTFSYGLIGGVGMFYTPGNVRISLDVTYKHGLSLINSPENRYNNDRLAGIGDAMDDLSIRNLAVSAGILFPMRFLSTGFKSTEN